MTGTEVAYRTLASPVGELLVAATGRGLVRVAFAVQEHETIIADELGPRAVEDPARLDDVAREFDEYFEGRRKTFDLALDLVTAHGFRREVIEYLPKIGYGTTASYAAVAEAVGNPGAVRAVGTACATNPLPIVLPCHRVVRSDGTLGEYVGGTEAKAALLNLEVA